MKTISQIAAEIGVSKQAVHKKIKQEPLSTNLHELMTTKGKTVYISVDGENLIKQAFCNFAASTTSTNSTTVSTNMVDDITAQFISSLQAQLDALTEQNRDLREQLNQERMHIREQADKLSDLAAQLAELARNNQILLGAEQSRTNPALITDCQTEEQLPKKRGFWNLFKK